MNSFIPKSIAALTGFAMILGLALPVSAVELVIVSWGGAYTASQQNAYHEPYMKNNPGVKIINDDSAAEGVAKLRAMNQAGNVTWDLVGLWKSSTTTVHWHLLLMEHLLQKILVT